MMHRTNKNHNPIRKNKALYIPVIFALLVTFTEMSFYHLSSADVLSLQMSRNLPFGTIITDLKIDQFNIAKIELPTPFLPASKFDIKEEFIDAMGRFIGSATFSNRVGFMTADVAYGCSAWVFELDKNNQPQLLNNGSQIVLAKDGFKCQDVTIDDKLVIFTAIDFQVKKVKLCTMSYLEPTPQSTCYVVDNDQQWSDDQLSKIKPTVISVQQPLCMYIVYFPTSPVDFFKNQFTVIKEESIKYVRIPIDNFTIQKLSINNKKAPADMVMAIVSSPEPTVNNLYDISFLNTFDKEKKNEDAMYMSFELSYSARSFYTCSSIQIIEHASDSSKSDNILVIDYKNHINNDQVVINFPNSHNISTVTCGLNDWISLEALTQDSKAQTYVMNTANGILWRKERDVTSTSIKQYLLVNSDTRYFVLTFDFQSKILNNEEIIQNDVLKVQFEDKSKEDNQVATMELSNDKAKLYSLLVNLNNIHPINARTEEHFYTPYEFPALIRLELKENGLQVDDPKVDYYNKIILGHEPDKISKCQPVHTASFEGLIAMLCQTNQVLIYSTSPFKKDGYWISNMGLLTVDFSDIKYDEVGWFEFIDRDLIAMTSKDKIVLIDLSKAKTNFIQKYQFDKNSKEFNFEKVLGNKLFEKIRRKTKQFKDSNSIFDTDIKVELLNNYSETITMNPSFFDASCLSLYLHSNNSVKLVYENLPFKQSDSLRIFDLGQGMAMMYFQDNGALYVYIYRDSALLSYQIGNLKDLKQLIAIEKIGSSHSFALLYSTNSDTIRIAIYNARFEPLERLHSDFQIFAQACKLPIIFSDQRDYQSAEIYFICNDEGISEDLKLQGWTIRLDGIYYNIDKDFDSQTIKVNGRDHKIINDGKRLQPAIDLEVNTVHWDPNTVYPDLAIVTLEDSKNIIINKGPLRKVNISDQNSEVQIIGRIELQKEVSLLDNLQEISFETNSEINYDKSEYQITYGSCIYVNQTIVANTNYHDCMHATTYKVPSQFYSPDKLWICRNKEDNNHYLTDLDKVSVNLKDSENELLMNFKKIFYIEINDNAYLFTQFHKSGYIRAIELNRSDEKTEWSVSGSSTFNFACSNNGSGISSEIFIHTKLCDQSIWFICHISSSVWIKTVNYIKEIINLDLSTEKLHLLKSQSSLEDPNLQIATFSIENDEVKLFGVIEDNIYEYSLANYASVIEPIKLYAINDQIRSDQLRIIIGEDYLAFIKSELYANTNQEVHIYNRNINNSKSAELYYVLERSMMSEIDYSISNLIIFKDSVSNGSKLVVVFLEADKNRLDFLYKRLVLKEFSIHELKLKVNTKILSETKNLSLVFTNSAFNDQVYSISIDSLHPTKSSSGLKIFVILILMIILGWLVAFWYRKYERDVKKRREQLQARMLDNDINL
jgi:hypothetical protein